MWARFTVLNETPIASAIAGCVIPLSRSNTIWMRSRCAAGIFHRSAAFSSRICFLVHLTIRPPESDSHSESYRSPQCETEKYRKPPRFNQLWKRYETMSPLGNADAPFTSGTPLLAVAEPSLFLFTFALGTFGRAIGNADALDTLCLRSSLVLGRIECSIRSDQTRRASQQGLMSVDGADQQVRVIRSPSVDLVIGDDLVFSLLQFHHLAELVGLAGVALAAPTVS